MTQKVTINSESENLTNSKQKENKYFTPDISDIRVGYEMEDCYHQQEWKKYVIKDEDEASYFFEMYKADAYPSEFRIPYLTKEQIETDGWKEGDTYHKTLEFENEYATYFCALFDNNKIRISEYTKTNPKEVWAMQRRSIVFEGECKCINTFRYICKLLKINQDNATDKNKQEDKQQN